MTTITAASTPASTSTSTRLTVGILTRNEARRIAACIESARFADQVVVIDSGSTDRTREIAASLGAEVHEYPDWQGFAEQRNRMLQHVSGDWVFFLDADEEIPPALREEILATVSADRDEIWEVRWLQVAFGKPLSHMRSHGGIRRMFRTRSIDRFTGVVHEHAQMRGETPPVRCFDARLVHYTRDTIHGSLLKLAQYAQLGAAKRAQAGKRGGVMRGLGSGLAAFVRVYLVQRAVLCGPEGFLYSLLVALESFFRYAALEYDRDALQRPAIRS